MSLVILRYQTTVVHSILDGSRFVSPISDRETRLLQGKGGYGIRTDPLPLIGAVRSHPFLWLPLAECVDRCRTTDRFALRLTTTPTSEERPVHRAFVNEGGSRRPPS